MKFINKLLKPLGLVLMKRDAAVQAIENNYAFLLLQKFVADNWVLFGGTILGDMLKVTHKT